MCSRSVLEVSSDASARRIENVPPKDPNRVKLGILQNLFVVWFLTVRLHRPTRLPSIASLQLLSSKPSTVHSAGQEFALVAICAL